MGFTPAGNSAATIPNIILTGGVLQLTAPGGIEQWQANMELQGTEFDSKPGALLQTNLGNSTRPGNFSLNGSSIWDLDIANGTLTGADWVDWRAYCMSASSSDLPTCEPMKPAPPVTKIFIQRFC